MAGDPLMTITEWGARLGLKKSAAYDKVARGEVDLINVASPGRRPRMRISEEAHRKYLDRNRVPAPSSKRSAA